HECAGLEPHSGKCPNSDGRYLAPAMLPARHFIGRGAGAANGIPAGNGLLERSGKDWSLGQPSMATDVTNTEANKRTPLEGCVRVRSPNISRTMFVNVRCSPEMF